MKLNEMLKERKTEIAKDYKTLKTTEDNKIKFIILKNISFYIECVRDVRKAYNNLCNNELITEKTMMKHEEMIKQFFTETFNMRSDCYKILFDLKKHGFDIEDINF